MWTDLAYELVHKSGPEHVVPFEREPCEVCIRVAWALREAIRRVGGAPEDPEDPSPGMLSPDFTEKVMARIRETPRLMRKIQEDTR